MPVSPPVQPLDADDATLREMLLDAELPPLLAALAHVTGDMSLVDPALRPPLVPRASGVDAHGGMSPEAQVRGREAAFAALRRFRDSGGRCAPDPGPEQLRQLMAFIAGDAPEEYLPLMSHELGLPDDAGAPGWTMQEVAPDADFSVAVIGAGMSGLVAAHRLAQAGVPFVVLEKNPEVGGVWYENSYPGCRLDTNNFAYSFSFAQKADWPQQFSPRDAIRDYFRDVSEEFGLRQHIRFRTEALAATYDEDTATWTVRLRTPDRSEESLRVSAVVTAVGQLNRPSLPDIAGRDSFAGLSWHSAQWNHDVDLRGLRVAVVGTGASAYQVVPSIAGQVRELTVFQRTPPWMLPTPAYHDDIPAGMRWLFGRVPSYHRWFRFYQFWMSVEGRRPFVQVDPEWEHDVSVSEANEALRQALVHHLHAQFGDRPDLLAKVVPDYPPGAKRMMRDNGVWPAALKQDNVHLVTEGIEEITPDGIMTRDGTLHAVDVIVYATGFRASEFLAPMTVRGKDGLDLHEHWKGDARAFLGINVPGFPNLFCVYGPNTNLVINGSILLFSENAVHYTLECLRMLLEGGHRAMDCRREPFDSYNRRIDEGNACMAWGASTVNSWYKNELGRVAQVWPFPILEYWQLTRAPDAAHYEFR
ncbi:MAG: flavin-containing monooxygenase [Actinomycetes bacterium]